MGLKIKEYSLNDWKSSHSGLNLCMISMGVMQNIGIYCFGCPKRNPRKNGNK